MDLGWALQSAQVVIPEAVRCEANGKRIDQKISDLMGLVNYERPSTPWCLTKYL